jgi:hypothetical protein
MLRIPGVGVKIGKLGTRYEAVELSEALLPKKLGARPGGVGLTAALLPKENSHFRQPPRPSRYSLTKLSIFSIITGVVSYGKVF